MIITILIGFQIISMSFDEYVNNVGTNVQKMGESKLDNGSVDHGLSPMGLPFWPHTRKHEPTSMSHGMHVCLIQGVRWSQINTHVFMGLPSEVKCAPNCHTRFGHTARTLGNQRRWTSSKAIGDQDWTTCNLEGNETWVTWVMVIKKEIKIFPLRMWQLH